MRKFRCDRCSNIAFEPLKGDCLICSKLGKNGLELDNCNLSNASLYSFTFFYASLRLGNLQNASFDRVKLHGCDFSAANLENIEFSNLSFKNNPKYGSEISHCYFHLANMKGASFVGAQLRDNYLVGANLDMLFVADENWIDGLDDKSKEYVKEKYILLDHNRFTSTISDRDEDKLWSDTFFLVRKEDAEKHKHYNGREIRNLENGLRGESEEIEEEN